MAHGLDSEENCGEAVDGVRTILQSLFPMTI